MEKEVLLGLVHNAALLLLIVHLYDLASARWRWQRLASVPVGLALGLVGVLIMLTPLARRPPGIE